MELLAIDTYKFINDLTNAGMPKKQAEVLSKTYANIVNERLVTKDELIAFEERQDHRFEALKTEMKNGFASLRSETKNEIASLRSETDIKIAALKEEIFARITAMEKKHLAYMITIVLSQITIASAVNAFFAS